MMKIRDARREEADALTTIAFAAKRHWNYPERWIRHWEGLLTISPDYLAENPTFVAEHDDGLIGFCAVQMKASDALLDHLWVLPSFMGKGVGRALFRQAEEVARGRGAVRIRIVGDPHAELFYARMGAVLYDREPASMEGEERSLPLLEKIL